MANDRGVFKRGRVWWIRYSAHGRMQFESTGSSEKRHATALLAKRRTEVFEGTHFPEKVVERTLGEIVDEYVGSIGGKRDEPNIRRRLERATEFFGSGCLLRAISHRRLREYKRTIETEPKIKGKGNRRPATVRQMLANLRSAFMFAVKTKFATVDPMRGFALPSVSNTRDRIATPEEIEKLLAHADDDLSAAIVLGVETGLRLGKIATLDWTRINLARRTMTLEHAARDKPIPAVVPLSADALKALKARGQKKEGALFSVTGNTLSLRFQQLTKRLGIRDLHFHDLRHTAFTRLRRAGVDLRTIQAISGHKRLEMLFRYQTVDDADLLAAIDKLK